MFLDPDILVTRRLDGICAALEDYSVLLTYHITAPIEDDRHPREIDFLQSGTYNLGFIALRRDETTKQLLRWWKRRLQRQCLVDIPRGLFVDQKWANLVPGLFPAVHVLRDPGYNVAYWNLHERQITFAVDGPRCNGAPLYFFHFSGYSPDEPERVSKHQDRYRMADIGETRRMFERYAFLLRERGYAEVRSWPYCYGTFSNGVPIPAIARRLYLLRREAGDHFGDPFVAEAEGSYYNWLTRFSGRRLPPLLMAMRDGNLDLVQAFPDPNGADQRAFLVWAVTTGKAEHQLDARLLAPALERLQDAGPDLRRAQRATSFRAYLKRLYHRYRQYPLLRGPLDRLRPWGQALFPRAARTRWPGPSPSEATGDGGCIHPPRVVGVNVGGYFESEKGVGAAVRSDLAALSAAGIPFVCNNFVDAGGLNRDRSVRFFATDNPFQLT